MPRKTPVKELLKEEEVPSSPLRRSSRITNSSPVPTKVVTRRNSSSESTSTSVPKVTRGRRSSLSQDVEPTNDAQADKRKSTSTIRTRRGSLTQTSEDRSNDESVQKTRSRGSSVPKDQKTVEVKKTTRRTKSEDPEKAEEEIADKSTRSLSGSLSKKNESKEVKISGNVIASTPNKKSDSSEVPSGTLQSIEEANKEDGSPDKEISSSTSKRRTDAVKIDLDLSVINEASLTEEEISPQKKNKAEESITEKTDTQPKNQDISLKLASPEKNPNIEVENKLSVEEIQVDEPSNKSLIKESTTKKETENEMFDSTMSENSFQLQLSPSAVEDTNSSVNANNSGNKENICPKVAESECEPMDVDQPETEKLSPVKKVIKPSRLSLAKKVTEVEHKLQVAEKITDEIDKFLTEENTAPFKNKTNDQEQTKVQNETLVVNIVSVEENNTKLSSSGTNKELTENEVVFREKKSVVTNSTIKETENNVDDTDKSVTDGTHTDNQKVKTASHTNEDLKNTKGNATELHTSEPDKNTSVQEANSAKDTGIVETCQSEHPTGQKTNSDVIEKDAVDLLNSSKLKSNDTEKVFEMLEDISTSKKSEKLDVSSTSQGIADDISATEVAKSEAIRHTTESPVQKLSDSKTEDKEDSSKAETIASSNEVHTNSVDEVNVPTNNSENYESVDQIEKTDACDSPTFKKPEGKTDKSSSNEENIVIGKQYEKKCDLNDENGLGADVETINEIGKESVVGENSTEKGESEQNGTVESNTETGSPAKKIENDVSVNSEEKKTEKAALDSSEVIDLSDDGNENETAQDEVVKSPVPKSEEKSTNGKNVEETKTVENDGGNPVLSRSLRKRSLDRTSITLHETVKAGEDKDKTVSTRIHKVVDLFCAGIRNTADVSINVSMEYTGQVTDSEDEKTDLLEISLVATADAVENESEIKKGSKRRKICLDDSQSSEIDESFVDAQTNMFTESPPKINTPSKKTVSPKNLQTEGTVEETSTTCEEIDTSIRKDRKGESFTSVTSIDENVEGSSPTKRSKKRKSLSNEDCSKLDPKESPIKSKNNSSLKSPKVKGSPQVNEVIDLNDSADDSSEDLSEDENNILPSDEESKYDILLAAPLEDSDDNDTTWKPSEDNVLIESESNDSDDDLKESFMEEVENITVSEEKSKRPRLVTSVSSAINEKSPNMSPEKAKSRKSLTSGVEPSNEISPKSKVSLLFVDDASPSGKKNKKPRFITDVEESDTKSSPKKKVNRTPYKHTKVEMDEEIGDTEEVTADDESEDPDDSVLSHNETSFNYVSLLGKSFEDSDANDTDWRPVADGHDSCTDESESSEEEESFMEKIRKEMPSVSNDSVFDEEEKVLENKAKKRKLFRLSRINLSENLGSSDSCESLTNRKKEIKKSNSDNEETKPSKKPQVTNKSKQSKSNDFQETKHVKNMLPESSEVRRKSKKRKHSNADDREALSSKTKREKLPDLREKLNRSKSKNKEDDAKSLYMKPSRKAPSGWDVTIL